MLRSPSTTPPAARLASDPLLVVGIAGWIGAVLVLDGLGPADTGIGTLRQLALGAGTWLVLALALRPESALVRTQTGLVVLFATVVEYTFSPLLEAYTYAIGTVPLFVPPGHGLVYLAAMAFGRSRSVRRHARALVAATALLGGGWALHGLLDPDRPDALGAIWFGCLLGFLVWGRSRLLYVGAFAVVSYLELLGTALGTWTWARADPVLGIVSQGNPPSGAAGGYGWFDLYALLLAPRLLQATRSWRRRSPSLAAK